LRYDIADGVLLIAAAISLFDTFIIFPIF
jgi:hypothetical protein